MAIAIIYAVTMNFGFFGLLTGSLATLEKKKMLEKNDEKQMEGEVAAKRVRRKEYEEVNQIKGLKFNSAFDMYCENIPIFEDVVSYVAILYGTIL